MSSNNIIDDDAFLFAGQNEVSVVEEIPDDIDIWRLLIVDDEPEIHKVTELALSGFEILGRRLEFVSAYSSEECLEYLRENSDIAVILLDVVMESDDAGLQAVKKIRDELDMHDVRIILRTGQPGYAPEEHVVTQYDINDYRTKTELTRNKLLTSVFSAIRSYSQIVEVRRSRDFLNKLNSFTSKLLNENKIDSFAQTLVKESCELFQTENNGFLLLNKSLEGLPCTDNDYYVAMGTGDFKHHIGHKYEKCLDEQHVSKVLDVINTKGHAIFDDCFITFIKTQSCNAVLLINTKEPLSLSEQLLQTYIANVASSLNNSLLLRKISTIAYQDKLTGLHNRARYIQQLDEYVAGRLEGDTAAIIDIDHFSDINDGLGLEVGNSVLASVSDRLKEQLGENVVIARIGADIFGVIGNSLTINPEVLDNLFEKPFNAQEHIIPVKATYGICPKPAATGLALLKQANIALNKAKRDLQSHCQYYKPEMEDETSWRLSMIRRLSADFAQDKLQVWYQPQLSAQTGKVIGMEALLRWPDGEGGYISPMVFIPLAEYSGLIVDIGEWVLKQSCQQLQKLTDLGLNDLRMAINVSMPQFRSVGFVDMVFDIFNSTNLSPDMLELEITESVVMDDPHLVIRSLERLKEHGFSIAIDDFGTGFSSLSYLHQLPLDRIKVDREFIKEIGEGGDGIIAETVIHLGQKLGLSTIAEGIETEFQLDYVRKLGCDEVQGFYYAPPLPEEKLKEFLLSRT